jgi:hypothetical protein
MKKKQGKKSTKLVISNFTLISSEHFQVIVAHFDLGNLRLDHQLFNPTDCWGRLYSIP